MGLRVRVGPVSVGRRGASVSAGPLSYSTRFGGADRNETSLLEFLPYLLFAVVWELSVPFVMSKRLRKLGYPKPALVPSILAIVLVGVGFPLALHFGFTGYEEPPTFWTGLAAAAFLNVFLGIVPGGIMMAITFGLLKPQPGAHPSPMQVPGSGISAASRASSGRSSVPTKDTARLANTAKPDLVAVIQSLAVLRDNGVLTEAEFQAKKAELLARL